MEVELACDGREAVERYQSKEEGYFDFIFMDIQMPGVDGFEAARLIKKYEREQGHKGVDIHFVSGEYFNAEDINEKIGEVPGAEKNGEVSCIRKPVSVQYIRRVLGGIK